MSTGSVCHNFLWFCGLGNCSYMVRKAPSVLFINYCDEQSTIFIAESTIKNRNLMSVLNCLRQNVFIGVSRKGRLHN